MIEAVRNQLDAWDDPSMWAVALDHILAELEPTPGTVVQIGRCSHWLRPRQCRWITADGEFALPVGYGSSSKKGQGAWSAVGLRGFDWSVMLQWVEGGWRAAADKTRTAVRIAIPSRTRRHQQAAVHTQWRTGKEKERRFYGFRRTAGVWTCTAQTHPAYARASPP